MHVQGHLLFPRTLVNNCFSSQHCYIIYLYIFSQVPKPAFPNYCFTYSQQILPISPSNSGSLLPRMAIYGLPKGDTKYGIFSFISLNVWKDLFLGNDLNRNKGHIRYNGEDCEPVVSGSGSSLNMDNFRTVPNLACMFFF